MTDQEINAAIAEWRGWQQFREEEYPHRTLWRETEEVGSRVWDEPNDYCNDANKMRDEEVWLLATQPNMSGAAYVANLLAVIRGVDADYFDKITWDLAVDLVTATPHQRAEALLRTIGKWKEETK